MLRRRLPVQLHGRCRRSSVDAACAGAATTASAIHVSTRGADHTADAAVAAVAAIATVAATAAATGSVRRQHVMVAKASSHQLAVVQLLLQMLMRMRMRMRVVLMGGHCGRTHHQRQFDGRRVRTRILVECVRVFVLVSVTAPSRSQCSNNLRFHVFLFHSIIT